MKLDDVLMLAKAGYSKTEIAALLGGTQTVQTTAPKAAPKTGAPPLPAGTVNNDASRSAAPTGAPAAPDFGAIAQSLAAITAKLDNLSTPTAGAIGAEPAAQSVDDIIRAAITPPQPDAAPDFSKGGVNSGKIQEQHAHSR